MRSICFWTTYEEVIRRDITIHQILLVYRLNTSNL